MEIFISIVLFVVGVALVIYGADWFTQGASSIARRFGISELVIGLTIVALGTSLPELVISTSAALQGGAGIALGNVIGSNIFNGLVILGVTAMITPIVFNPKMLSREIPFNLLASVALLLVSGDMLYSMIGAPSSGGSSDGYITRNGGMLLLCFLLVFVRYTFSAAKNGDAGEAADAGDVKPKSGMMIILFIVGGLAALIFGGRMFVNGASSIAAILGVPEAIIGVTIVAVGTSLPELAVSVSAARKGSVGIALGNVLGSNILNVFFIMGLCSTISPVSLSGFDSINYYVLLLSSILIYIVAKFFGKATITRIEGTLLLLIYIAYTVYLVVNI